MFAHIDKSDEIIYYGDQSITGEDSLKHLLEESRNSVVLAQFLQRAFEKLQLEATSCVHSEVLGRNLEELIQQSSRPTDNHVVIGTVASLVGQLGWTIVHRHHHVESWHNHAGSTIYGVCTGSLAAIAAAAARSDVDFVDLALECLSVAFRLAVKVAQRSSAIDTASDPWAIAVPTISRYEADHVVKKFNESKEFSTHRAVYISAYSVNGVTLSGPPKSLQSLVTSASMKSYQTVSLPIYGLFHASHLPAPDIASIIGHSELWSRTLHAPSSNSLVLPHFSSNFDGTVYELLSNTIFNILQMPVDFDSLICDLKAKNTSTSGFQMTTLGPANCGYLKNALGLDRVRVFGADLPSQSAKDDYTNAIAITGMGFRLPEAHNTQELWDILMEGRDLHRQIPKERFDVSTHYDPTGEIPNTSVTQWGCFDDHVGDFDLSLFRMSPREALQTDPAHRLMLITAYEALESSGYYDDKGRRRAKVGTFYGQAGDDYCRSNAAQNIDTNYITGGIRAFGPGRVGYYFGWEGPSMSIDTACSSSAVAINQACSSLLLRESDMALAGGANLLTNSDYFAGLSRAKFVSSTGPCKTLDETADGYCRADGVASVVLKRYSDAIRDKDNILGVIRSIETNHAGSAISITHPDANSQYALFHSVLTKAGINAYDVDHIEMHGTGTQAGDLAETSSIARLLDQTGGRRRPSDHPLTIASVKPNVGHSEAASGVTSLIKAILMMERKWVPRHIGIKTRYNPKLPLLVDQGIEPVLENRPFIPVTDKRKVLVNNFNATGGSTALLLEEHSNPDVQGVDPRGHYPIVLSAATSGSLRRSIERLLTHLKAHSETDLASLSYTLTARRLHHSHGFGCVADRVPALIQQLESEVSATTPARSRQRGAHNSTVFVFTGQALSYSGMAADLFKTNPTFERHLLDSDKLCQSMDLPTFIDVIRDGDADFSGFGVVKTHLALVALEIALADLFQSWGIHPAVVMGHSLGEYSALCVSKALSLADTLYLVGKRAQLIDSICVKEEYAMAATSLSPAEASHHLKEYPACEIACFNGPAQTIITGPRTDLDDLSKKIEAEASKTKRLAVDFGFHSSQMDAMLPDYESIVKGVEFHEPTTALVSTYLGDFVGIDDLDAQYLCHQTRKAVRFQEAVEKVSTSSHVDSPFWLEIGPAPACAPLINQILDSGSTMSTLHPRKPNWQSISEVMTTYYISRDDVCWDRYHMNYLEGVKLLQLPSYPFDMTNHFIQYEGDWAITKNRARAQDHRARTNDQTLDSSTLHTLRSDIEENGTRVLVFTSNLVAEQSSQSGLRFRTNETLHDAEFIYMDMAMTAAKEISKRSPNGVKPDAMELTEFKILDGATNSHQKAFEINLELTATVAAGTQSTALISITSPSEHREVARCKVSTGRHASQWKEQADNTAFLYITRMDLLEMPHMGLTKLSAMQNLAQSKSGNDAPQQSPLSTIQQLTVNSNMSEAVGTISYTNSKGNFTLDPQFGEILWQMFMWASGLDGVNEPVPPPWKEFRILRPMEVNNTYRVHVRFQISSASGMPEGDLHVFHSSGVPVMEIKGMGIVHHIMDDTMAVAKQIDSSDSIREDDTGLVPRTLQSTLKASPVCPMPIALSPPSTTPSSTPSNESLNGLEDTSPVTAGIDVLAGLVDILVAELGLSQPDVAADTHFENLGIDSIMSMTILAKMKAHMKAGTGKPELPGNLLLKYNTIAKLQDYFQEQGTLSIDC